MLKMKRELAALTFSLRRVKEKQWWWGVTMSLFKDDLPRVIQVRRVEMSCIMNSYI
jgi:hypothetical protein